LEAQEHLGTHLEQAFGAVLVRLVLHALLHSKEVLSD
jgi:hypothetical protein